MPISKPRQGTYILCRLPGRPLGPDGSAGVYLDNGRIERSMARDAYKVHNTQNKLCANAYWTSRGGSSSEALVGSLSLRKKPFTHRKITDVDRRDYGTKRRGTQTSTVICGGSRPSRTGDSRVAHLWDP